MGRRVSLAGHNGGPTLEAGKSWRRHCWREARAALLPTLPIEVVRLRVRRAAEIGLDYKTYAGVRASTGHDIVAFLFSTNALRLLAPRPMLPADRAAKLEKIAKCGKIALVQAPLVGPLVERTFTPGAVTAIPVPKLLNDARAPEISAAATASAPRQLAGADVDTSLAELPAATTGNTPRARSVSNAS